MCLLTKFEGRLQSFHNVDDDMLNKSETTGTHERNELELHKYQNVMPLASHSWTVR